MYTKFTGSLYLICIFDQSDQNSSRRQSATSQTVSDHLYHGDFSAVAIRRSASWPTHGCDVSRELIFVMKEDDKKLLTPRKDAVCAAPKLSSWFIACGPRSARFRQPRFPRILIQIIYSKLYVSLVFSAGRSPIRMVKFVEWPLRSRVSSLYCR